LYTVQIYAKFDSLRYTTFIQEYWTEMFLPLRPLFVSGRKSTTLLRCSDERRKCVRIFQNLSSIYCPIVCLLFSIHSKGKSQYQWFKKRKKKHSQVSYKSLSF
jgi:hypothetical protein